MSQATRNISRRTLLSHSTALVATVPLASFGIAAAMKPVEVFDPIFAAIEAHKIAEEAFAEALRALDEDDPAVEVASDKATEAALALVNDIAPTTLAGVAAVMKYAYECEAHGTHWPNSLEDSERPNALGLDWSYFLLRSLAEAVQDMAAGRVS